MPNLTLLLRALALFLLFQTAPLLSAQNPPVNCDTVLVVAGATGGVLTCNTPYANLTGALHATALSYQWAGPGGFSSTERVVSWYKPGTYVLTVTGPYGCTAQASAKLVDSCLFYPLVPPECSNAFVPPADDCNDVCVRPFLPAEYWFSNYDAAPGPTFFNNCSIQVHNDQWFAFVAGATSGSITAESANCTNGDGIQLALLDGCNGEVVACDGGGGGSAGLQVTLTATDLIIGKVYYLMVDGFVGDRCDYKFIIKGNICTAPNPTPTNPKLNGLSQVCPKAATTYKIDSPPNATAFLWTAPPGSLINGMPSPVVLYTPNGKSVDIIFGDQPGFVTVRALYYFHPPSEPLGIHITMQPIPPTILPNKEVCFEDLPFVWEEEPYTILSAPGTYNLTSTPYSSYLGCDSIVKQKITILPPISKNLGARALCKGDCFTINGTEYCESGLYSEVLTSWLGCDSIVTFSLVVIDPIAEITGGGKLTCATSSVTLGSAPSAGLKRWWSGTGQLLGTGNTLTVSLPGTYILTTMNISLGVTCEKSDTIFIVQDIAPVQVIATGGTLTCTAPELTLSGSVSAMPAQLQWSGPGGFTSTLPNPVVSVPGDYTLKATNPDNGCAGSATATVTVDQTPPSAAATGGTLTCKQPNVLLSGTSNTSGATFEWTGPGGFFAQIPEPETDMPGTYLLTVTAPNGCTATASTQVAADQQALTATATGGLLTCSAPQTTLNASADLPPVLYAWSGPKGFLSDLPNPATGEPGVYTVTVTAANGCTGTAEALVLADQAPPIVIAQGGTITCIQSEIVLSGEPGGPGTTHEWTGPDGFYSQEQNPVVEKPGIYTLTVMAPNGCTGTATAEVPADLNPPDVEAFADTLDCTHASANLYGISEMPQALFHWTGPGNFQSDLQNPQASQPGLYVLTVTNPLNGCKAAAQATMVATLNVPGINVIQLVPGCGDSLLYLDASSPIPGVQFYWTGPNGFTANTEDIQVTVADWYRVEALAPNGCGSEIQILAIPAPPVPQVSISPQMPVLTCLTPVITLSASADIPGCTFDWSTPGGTVPQPGVYRVTASSPDGCTATAEVTVELDANVPALSAEGGILTCAQPTTLLTAVTTTPGTIITWYGSGFPTTQNPALVSAAGDYTAVATAPNGCTSSVTVMVVDSCLVGTVNPVDLDVADLVVYPNPGNGIVYVRSLNGAAVSAVMLHRIDGMLVRTEMPEPASRLLRFDWSELPAGVYVISANIKDRWVTRSLILME